MNMQHLKPIFLAFWVAGCVFHVAGFPTEDQTTGWFGAIRKTPTVVLSGTGAVAKGVAYGASEVAKGVADYGVLIGEVTSGVADGAHSVAEKIDYGAEEAILNGLVNGANAVAKGYKDYGVHEAINTGLAYGAIAYGASAAVKYGADEITKRVVDYLVRQALKNGAKAFAGGAMSAANTILSSAKFFSGGAQDAANVVTGGILHGATVVSGGVQKLANALSGVSFEKLLTSLGLPKDISKFNMFDMLANFIISQSFRTEGGKTSMNFETATLFLEKLAVDVPTLKQPGIGLKIVSFVMPQIHTEDGKATEQHAVDVMSKALKMYFRNVDEGLKQKLIKEAAPRMPAAARGHKDAALEIVKVFIDRNHLKEAVGAAAVRSIGDPLQHVLNTAKFVSGIAAGLVAQMLVKQQTAYLL